MNGREFIYIPVTKQEGANMLDVTDGMRERILKLTEIAAGSTVRFVFDQSQYIREVIHNLQKEGLLGAALAGFMIYIVA